MIGDFEDVFLPAADGLSLHARIYPCRDSGAWPAICLPGLTRNVRDFHELALFLSQEAPLPRRVIAIDSRGRGESARDPDPANYSLPVEARDAMTVLDALDVERGHFVGTSRGGLIVHLLAVMDPGRLGSVILNDVGPALGVAGLAQIKQYLSAPYRRPASFAEAEALQRTIHGAAFPALTDADWARMTAAIYRNDGGLPVSDYDPAIAAAFAGLDLEQPLGTLWPQFDALPHVPLMVIRGERSMLLDETTVARMQRSRPDLSLVVIAGQGHPPMLETGDLPTRIAAFMASAESNKAS